MGTKRLAVYTMYTKNGMIYDYIEYLLRELKKEVDEIYVVCNAPINSLEKKRLSDIVENFFIRENIGYDALALKDTLGKYLEWDKIHSFDELIIVNNSFWGPFISFSKIFHKMEKIECDFWALTGEERPYFHLQSYFVVVRKKMLVSDVFRQFWRELSDNILTHHDAVNHYEYAFTPFFISKGFKATTYIETTYGSYYDDYYDMVRLNKFPVLKKKSIIKQLDEIWHTSLGQDAVKILKYLKEYNLYETDMIWQVLLTEMTSKELDDVLCLDYIENEEKGFSDNQDVIKHAIIIGYFSDLRSCTYINDFFCQIQNEIESIVLVNKSLYKQMKEKLSNYINKGGTVIAIQDERKEEDAIFIDAYSYWSQYKYIGFLHDKMVYKEKEIPKIIKSKLFHLFENEMKSTNYVINLLTHLQNEKRLAALWVESNNFEAAFLEHEMEETFTFWIKKENIESLRMAYFTKERDIYDNKQFVQWLWKEGFYCERCHTKEYARLKLRTMRRACEKFGEMTGFYNTLLLGDTNRLETIIEFCHKRNTIYIFGNGINAKRIYSVLRDKQIEIQGFIVSNGKKDKEEYCGVAVLELDNITIDRTTNINNEIGIIVAISPLDSGKIKGVLIKKGFSNIMIYD